MAFIVTARKYRPQRFDEVVGQEHITTTLKNAIRSGRVAHAYLFTGPRGIGKTTTARILAKSLNCENPKDGEPCNKCEMCKSISTSQLMDIIEIDAASNRGIDEVRTLRESVKYAPSRGKYKVYIIDEVHMLTRDSFNAFLKTLEEPPSHTVFIFATTDVQRVPLTIISRCQRYDFRRINLETIKQLLKKISKDEKITIDDKTLTIIAKKADGGLRDAESFFDQAVAFCGNNVDFTTVVKILNLIDEEIYFKISDAVITKNFNAAYEVTETIYQNGWNFFDFMEGLIEHFRNIMTVEVTGNINLIETAEAYKEMYKNYLGKFSAGDLLRILNFINQAKFELKSSQNHKIKIEVALCHIIGLEKSETITGLIASIPASSTGQSVPILKESSTIYHPGEKQNFNKPPVKFESPRNEVKKVFDNQITSIQDTIFNFDSVLNKWEGFVNAINSERKLVFGPILNQVSPVGLDRNKINVVIKDKYGKIIFEQNQDYLDKKTYEIFGKKLVFNFVEETAGKTSENDKPASVSQPAGSEEKDPIIKAIISELGGEEIN
jgi:DNA polymerase-3 subunit gamma/tau